MVTGVKALVKKYNQELPKGWKKELKQVFDYIDKDGSGTINAKEWKKAVKEWSKEQ